MYFPNTTHKDFRESLGITLLLHILILGYATWGLPGLFTHSAAGALLYITMFIFTIFDAMTTDDTRENIRETVTFPKYTLSVLLIVLIGVVLFSRVVIEESSDFLVEIIVILTSAIGFVLVYFSALYASVILIFPFRGSLFHERVYIQELQ